MSLLAQTYSDAPPRRPEKARSGNHRFLHGLRPLLAVAVALAAVPVLTSPATAACSFDITPLTRNHGFGATTASVAVETGNGCAWTVVNSANWITIVSGASGVGDGLVTYSLAANSSSEPRQAVVRIAGRDFTITQSGVVCTYTLSPTGHYKCSGSSTGSVQVTTSSPCSWSVVNPNDWIVVTSSGNGTGSGKVYFTVLENPLLEARTGILLIGGQPFTIVQAGAPFVAAPDKNVACDAPWDFDAPTITAGTNTSIRIVSTVTNVLCGSSFTATRVWEVTDDCARRFTTSQTVIAGGGLPSMQCPSTITVANLQAVPPPPASLTEFIGAGGQAGSICGSALAYQATDGPLEGTSCLGTIQRTHTVSDGCGNVASCVQTIQIQTGALNTSANDDFLSASNNLALTIPVSLLLANDSHTQEHPLTVLAVSRQTLNGGSASLAGVNVLYTPPPGFVGIDRFDYAVSDECGATATAAVIISITVARTNSSPVAGDDVLATDKDTLLTVSVGTLLANDTDPDGDALTVTAVGPLSAQGGVVQLVEGILIYLPPAGFVGADSLEYTVDDGYGGTATATVAINVRRPNNLPVATDDTVATERDVPLMIVVPSLLANDVDPDGDALEITGISAMSAQGGSVTLIADQVSYIPAPGFVGSDTFTYTVNDGHGGTATATVTVTVRRPNSTPVAQDDHLFTDRDASLTISVTSLLANDLDADGDPLTIISVSATSAQGGTVTLVGDQISYVPTPGFIGSDTFTYTVSDGQGATATATVTVTVRRPNTAPVAQDDHVFTEFDTSVFLYTTNLFANDFDADGDPLTLLAVSLDSVQGGAAVPMGSQILYIPPPEFSGADSITYTIGDGQGGTATATVAITIRPPNQSPTAGNATVFTPVNTPIRLGRGTLLALATDPDGDPLSLVSVSVVSIGSVALDLADAVAQPPQDYLGTFQIKFVVSDGRGGLGTGTVSVIVHEVAARSDGDPPVFNPQTGLFEQRVTVLNNTASTIAAFQLGITGLRANIRVWNATGTSNGVPYVQYNHPVDPGQSAVLRLEYHVPDRQPFSPVITMTTVLPAGTTNVSSAGSVAIDRAFMDARLPAEPRFVVEFTSQPGRTYTILYSDDAETWTPATPSITATANRTQWYDDGPPKTLTKPGAEITRFYRVLMAP